MSKINVNWCAKKKNRIWSKDWIFALSLAAKVNQKYLQAFNSFPTYAALCMCTVPVDGYQQD